MDAERFDALTRVAGAAANRRQVLKALVGVVAGGLLSRFDRPKPARAGHGSTPTPAGQPDRLPLYREPGLRLLRARTGGRRGTGDHAGERGRFGRRTGLGVNWLMYS